MLFIVSRYFFLKRKRKNKKKQTFTLFCSFLEDRKKLIICIRMYILVSKKSLGFSLFVL